MAELTSCQQRGTLKIGFGELCDGVLRLLLHQEHSGA